MDPGDGNRRAHQGYPSRRSRPQPQNVSVDEGGDGYDVPRERSSRAPLVFRHVPRQEVSLPYGERRHFDEQPPRRRHHTGGDRFPVSDIPVQDPGPSAAPRTTIVEPRRQFIIPPPVRARTEEVEALAIETQARYAAAGRLPPEDSGSRLRRRRYSSADEVIRERIPSPDFSGDELARARSRSRSRARTRARRQSEQDLYERQYVDYTSYEVQDENLDAYDNFHFEMPAKGSLESSKEDEQSDIDSSRADVPSATNEATQSSRLPRAMRIFSSRYNGSAELGGSHSATLTLLHDPMWQKLPLFRWLHIRQQVMNFDDFWGEISRQPHFSDPEKLAIGRLKTDVQKNCIKLRRNASGARVGFMDPRCIEVSIPAVKKKPTSDAASQTSVKWICLPYFALQQYSGLLTASDPGLFPPQTLLQAQYSGSTQQRDMEQAVCQLGASTKGECFHIDQLWCLVVGNSFLVTCGSMPQSDLQGETIKMYTQPSPKPALTTNTGTILVTYSDALTWAFTTEECSTWVAFMSHFQVFWPQNLEFKHKNTVVTGEDWPRILRLATRPRGSVTLSLKEVDNPEPSSGVLQPLSAQNTTSEKATSGSTQKQGFLHVLALLEDVFQPPSLEVSQNESKWERLKTQLKTADEFMLQKTPFSVKMAYKDCKDSTREEVYNYLKELAADFENDEADKHSYEERIDVFNAADLLFQLFLPPTFNGPTVGRFWGAIARLVKKLESNASDGDKAVSTNCMFFRWDLRTLIQTIQAFQNIFAFANEQEQNKINVPPQFVTAWLHIVSAVTSLCHPDHNRGRAEHLDRATSLIDKGITDIIEEMPNEDLLYKTAMLPMEILSLVTMELLEDQVGKADDISETYSQYLRYLDTAITMQPSDRSFQHRIDLVQQEMTSVKRALAKQRSVVGTLRRRFNPTDGVKFMGGDMPYGRSRRERSRVRETGRAASPPPYYDELYDYGRPPYDTGRMRGSDYEGLDNNFAAELTMAAKLSPTDADGFRGLLLSECARFVEQREFDFRRYTEYAEDLSREVIFKMDWTKDRQENAIYAFTLVTIVFLPLSAVASIFGMNTIDVRGMPFGQWLYWAVAVPVTVLVFVVALWWMDELNNVLGWMTGGGRQKGVSARRRAPAAAPQQQQQQEEVDYFASVPAQRQTVQVVQPMASTMEATYRSEHLDYPPVPSTRHRRKVTLY